MCDGEGSSTTSRLSTGAAKAVALVLPELKGKLNGITCEFLHLMFPAVDFVCLAEKKYIY